MEQQQDLGDGRAVAATPSSQQDAVSPVPASIPIADRTTLPRRASQEQYLRETFGLPPEWQAYKWEMIGGTAANKYHGCGAMFTGLVVTETITRGPRKGHPHWKKGDKSTEASYPVLDGAFSAWREQWERDTGLCSACEGTGQDWAGWSAEGGNRYRDCKRCSATGEAQAIEAGTAETGTGSACESAVAESDAPKENDHG